MPKTVLKGIAGLVVLMLFVVAGLGVALPRLIARDDFQETLREAAEDALGSPVTWRSLEAGILPPRLTIREPSLAAEGESLDAASVKAESIDLRLAILPIFRSRIEVASLIVRGAEVVMIRREDGSLLLPVIGASQSPSPATSPESTESSSFDFGIRGFAISESRIIIRDETLSPAFEWRIEEVDLEAGARLSAASLAIEMDGQIGVGVERVGRLAITGRIDLDGGIVAELEIEAFPLAALAPYLKNFGTDADLTGELSCEATVRGTSSEISKIEWTASLDTLSLRTIGGTLAADAQWTAVMEGEGPIRFNGDLELAEGGQVNLEGTATQDGILDLDAKILSLDLSATKSFLPDSEMELAGQATGTAKIFGPANALSFVELELEVQSGRLRVPEYSAVGPYELELRVDEPFSENPRGQIEVNLTASVLDYQGVFNKPAGMRALLTTSFSTNQLGETEFESRIKFKDIDEILLRGSIGEATSIVVTAPKVDLAGWDEILSALEGYSPRGFVLFDGLGIRSASDASHIFSGRIVIENLSLETPDAGRLDLNGVVRGVGPDLQTDDFRLTLAGLTLGLQGRVQDPIGSMRFDFSIESRGGAEANDLFSALSSAQDIIFGDLQVAGSFQGRAADDVDIMSSLVGALRVTVGKAGGGRLRGVSFLKTILDQFPVLGGAARLSQPFRSGKSLDDYFAEDFEVIDGDFEIGSGRINARSLRLVYDGYEANLKGAVLLPSLEVDMTGEVLLKADLVSALGGLLGAELGDRKPVRIPLTHVTHTLAEPKIEMTPRTLVAIPKLLFKASGLDTLTLGVGRAIGRVLGGGGE